MATQLPVRRVLLVNHSPDEREMYAEWFHLRGCSTLQAETAEEAYQMAQELEPEVVITGVKLAGHDDGLSLTRRLKQNAQTQHVPVVVLSGYVFAKDDTAAWLAGCDLVIHKPCLPDALAEAIDELLPRLPKN